MLNSVCFLGEWISFWMCFISLLVCLVDCVWLFVNSVISEVLEFFVIVIVWCMLVLMLWF